MDKSRILNVITEAEAKLVALGDALDSGDNEAADWIFLILSAVFQDLQRLAEEQIGIGKQKLSMTFQSAFDAVEEGRVSIQACDYRLVRLNAALLSLELREIKKIITTTPQ